MTPEQVQWAEALLGKVLKDTRGSDAVVRAWRPGSRNPAGVMLSLARLDGGARSGLFKLFPKALRLAGTTEIEALEAMFPEGEVQAAFMRRPDVAALPAAERDARWRAHKKSLQKFMKVLSGATRIGPGPGRPGRGE